MLTTLYCDASFCPHQKVGGCVDAVSKLFVVEKADPNMGMLGELLRQAFEVGLNRRVGARAPPLRHARGSESGAPGGRTEPADDSEGGGSVKRGSPRSIFGLRTEFFSRFVLFDGSL